MRSPIFVLISSMVLATFAASQKAALPLDKVEMDGGASSSVPRSTLHPPRTKVEVVDETLHGQKISDPYRWLENGDSPETQAFTREELAYTRSLLDALPGREKIHARLKQLYAIGAIGTPHAAGDFYFYTRRDGAQNQPVLYVRRGVSGKDRVLVDVNALAKDGTVALDWWSPSHKGALVAYGTSPGGSEISTLHIIDTESGRLLPDTIPQTRAASLAWFADNSAFFYTRYPKPGDVPAGQELYNRRVYCHTLGSDPKNDLLIFGEGRDPQDWPNVSLSEDGRWLVISVEQGWAKSEMYIKNVKANTPPAPVVEGKNFLYRGDVFKDEIYILTNEDAPRYRVFKAPAQNPERANWREIIPQTATKTDAVLMDAKIIQGKLFAQYEKSAISQLKVFSLDGKLQSEVQLPGIGAISTVEGEWDGREAFFAFQSYTVPPTIYRYNASANHSSEWARVEAPIDSSRYEVKQVSFRSKDGTPIPMFIVSKKGMQRDGRNPTVLSGYGGFNISVTPAFDRGLYYWLERGGVYAKVNLRGGAEFGEDWHRAGMLANKQNVFDDFIGAAEFLIAQKYTAKEHLGIEGRSNGGLLTGAAFTQRPDLFKAVLCGVPLLDMLRYQNFQIARLWIPEYGSSQNPEQFKWLYAYSPYHHIKPGTLYPAILIYASAGDTRVDPLHARKMVARLQAEAKNGDDPSRPILLRIEPKAGHGAGKPLTKTIEEWTDFWSFMSWQLGITH